jgi:hypothetical protein
MAGLLVGRRPRLQAGSLLHVRLTALVVRTEGLDEVNPMVVPAGTLVVARLWPHRGRRWSFAGRKVSCSIGRLAAWMAGLLADRLLCCRLSRWSSPQACWWWARP